MLNQRIPLKAKRCLIARNMDFTCVDKFRVMLMGDSHVRRLLEHITSSDKEEKLDQNFSLKDADVAFRHSGGANVARLRRKMPEWLNDFQPHILVVMGGGNDLTEQDVALHETADELLELARVAKDQHSVMKVIVCAQFDRTTYPEILPPYPRKLYLFNQYLKEILRPVPQIIYWRHAKLVKLEGKLILDGVHLKAIGNKNLYTSMKSLLIRIIKGLRYAN